MSVVLFQHSTHTGNVLDRELEHDQVHRSLTYLIVLVQRTENNVSTVLRTTHNYQIHVGKIYRLTATATVYNSYVILHNFTQLLLLLF